MIRIHSSLSASIPLFYAALLWPGRYTIAGLFDPEAYYPALMYDSGVWSLRLLIAAIAVTPILLAINRLGRGQALGRWLLRRRRHLGLASAFYAVLHMVHYLLEVRTLDAVLFDAVLLEYAVGWLSFVLLAALAVTSNDASVRRLGRNWKRLHLWVYPAGALAFWHWYLLDWYVGRVVFWVALFLVPPLLQWMLRRIRGRIFAR
ncbi:ferric reductase-like transmembrane domain-containing protein [uncultured Tateyamaria sp.]|uniref:ferric reductase-like transmembrane domain-containing protein n=1 Tax=uncultured Tateyamaria sp. TaxID=455651 RepID=UPI0026397073|nr:ferric reductase-like transmembrane domain-containing protein [uncultured Tateyamaria sp.]